LRTINYKLPIETSRWNNIDRANIIWTKCDNHWRWIPLHNGVPTFKKFKNRFIITNLQERPNILKFKQIMSASQKQNLEKSM
jgi:hypothetical protein